MQACFVVMSKRSCSGCDEISKAYQRVSSHLEGWQVMDVYKPHRAKSQNLTVKSSSYRSNRSYYQLPNWFSGADPT